MKFLCFALVSLLVNLSVTVAHAADEKGPGCIAATEVEDVQKAVRLPAEFSTNDLCDAKTKSYKLMQAMIFLKDNSFPAGNLPFPLNQNILPDHFWDFFIKDIRSISNAPDAPPCAGVVAYYLTGFDDHEINLCPNFYSDTTMMIERASALLHEARHADPHMYVHEKCLAGFSKGRNSCDATIETQGSYAVSVESIAKMSISPVVAPAERSYGKFLLLQFLTRSFNTPVTLGKGDFTAIYLQDEQGRGLIFDGTNQVSVPGLGTTPPISRYFSLVAFKDDGDAFTADLFASQPSFVDVNTDTLLAYNNMMPDQRPHLVSILNTLDFGAFITDQYISVNAFTTLPITQKPKQVFTAGELGLASTDDFFIRDEAKNLFEVRWDQSVITVHPAALAWPFSFEPKALSVFQNQRLALNEAGEVLVFQDGQWKTFAPLQGRKFVSMSRPFLWHIDLFN